MKLDLVFEPHAESIRTHVFVNGHKAGELVMPEDAWLAFAAALHAGAALVLGPGATVSIAPTRPELAPELVREVHRG